MEYTENKSSKKLIVFMITCVLIMIALIGYTYSYFNVSVTNDTTISGRVASLSLTLNVSRVAPSNTNGLIPQLDEYITSAVIGRNGSCIDDNNNNICQIYQIKVKNTSSVSLYANGTVALNANNNPNLKWAQISGTTSPTLVSSVNTPSTVKLVENELFTSNQEKIYYIVVWISETGEAQYDTGSFGGIVTFGDANTSLSEQTLTKLGLTSNGIELVNFTSAATTDEGIFTAEDDLGTSYYFRGATENNYVKFAEFYWRIIRINGDGSIRMIYDGTSAHANGVSSTDRQIGKSSFNILFNDNTYVGYMYGTIGTSDYATTHSNTTDSTIKTYVDDWFKTNIVDKGYAGSVVDAIYCNDRTVVTDDIKYQNWFKSETKTAGSGVGTSDTMYGTWARIESEDNYSNLSATELTLKCNQVIDRFTVEPTIGSVAGNDKLTYPVGLITADEVIFAGAYMVNNSAYYLYTGNYYWTMSASHFGSSRANVFLVVSNGSAPGNTRGGVSVSSYGVKPVISISPNAIQYGDGTSTNPFRMTSEV